MKIKFSLDEFDDLKEKLNNEIINYLACYKSLFIQKVESIDFQGQEVTITICQQEIRDSLDTIEDGPVPFAEEMQRPII